MKSFINKRVFLFLFFFALLLLAAVFLLDTPFEAMWVRFQDTFFRHDISGSTQEHNLFVSKSFDVFGKHPVFGIGAGNFETFYLKYIDPSKETAYVYNVYLRFLAETGIVGFVGQISFVLFVIYSGFRGLTVKEDSKSRLLESALLCAYISILISNLFYAYYILLFVWLLIGLMLSVSLNKESFDVKKS